MSYIYYRISDKGYKKEKLPGADKEFCLRNCLDMFRRTWQPYDFSDKLYGSHRSTQFRIVADNVSFSRPMIERISEEYQVPVLYTNKGNAGSLIWSIKNAIQELSEYDRVYFCEDDYLHNERACDLLSEGFTVGKTKDLDHPEYVSLYDHPDKYSSIYDMGENCAVYRGALAHWKQTQSTTMTFGTWVYNLKEDLSIWEKWTDGHEHPADHAIFVELGKNGRRLVTPMPGAAVHIDLTLSVGLGHISIEPWAIEMACNNLESKLRLVNDEGTQEILGTILKKYKTLEWDRLKLLQSLWVTMADVEQSLWSGT